MADRYTIKVTVISQEGHCSAGHKVGEEWIFDANSINVPGGLCLFALGALQNMLVTLRFGGVFPWEKDPDTTSVVCPDVGNPCVFELRRLREQEDSE